MYIVIYCIRYLFNVLMALYQVNNSTVPFSYSPPELFRIQNYCRDILGWTEEEIRAKILPVIQRWLPFLSGVGGTGDLTQQQRRIDSFYHTYHGNSRVAKICSSRLRNAVQNKNKKSTSLVSKHSAPTNSGPLSSSEDEEIKAKPKPKVVSKKTIAKKRKRPMQNDDNENSDIDDDDVFEPAGGG